MIRGMKKLHNESIVPRGVSGRGGRVSIHLPGVFTIRLASDTLLKPGTRAPEFSLQTSDGGLVRSTDYIGKKAIVIFFYPKDDTLGCTIESCAFRDSYEEFLAVGAEIIGISTDSAASHHRFREKHSLPFILASDAGRKTAHAYGVAEGPLGLAGRATFVIDKRGMVRDAFSSRLRVKRHVSRALDLVRGLARETE